MVETNGLPNTRNMCIHMQQKYRTRVVWVKLELLMVNQTKHVNFNFHYENRFQRFCMKVSFFKKSSRSRTLLRMDTSPASQIENSAIMHQI